MSRTEDWADWAGDHPEQAEAELRAEHDAQAAKAQAWAAKGCYCRGAAICDEGHHICTGCTCDHDGAPLTREEVTR